MYEDNDPAKGYNRWVREASVRSPDAAAGRNGKIVDRFEGAVSVHELEDTVREKLASGT